MFMDSVSCLFTLLKMTYFLLQNFESITAKFAHSSKSSESFSNKFIVLYKVMFDSIQRVE